MLLKRTVKALVYSGLALVALVVFELPGRAAEDGDTSEPPTEEATTAPAPPGEEPAEQPEDSPVAGEGAETTEDAPAADDGPATELPPAAEEQAPDPRPSLEAGRGVVQVVVMSPRDEIRRRASGFVVQVGHVVTAAHVVEDEDRISVVVPSDGARTPELIARVRHVERHADLALLVVGGLELEPLVLAKDGFDVGRNVVSTGFWGTAQPESVSPGVASLSVVESKGAVGEHRLLPATRDDAAVELLRHNAMIPAAGYGGPLLNDCGEVVGVNRGSPETTRRALRRGEAPQGVVYAAGVTAVVGLLQPAGVPFTRTESSCTEPVAVARAEAEKARRAEEEARRAEEDASRLAEEKEAEAAAKQAELDRAREERDAESANVADLQRRLEEAERTGAEDAETLRSELEEAEASQEAAQQKVDRLDGEVQALERQVEEGQQNLVITIVIAVTAVVLLAIVAGVFYRRRSLELAYARQQAAGGQQQAPVGRPLPTHAAQQIPDYLLTGTTGEGRPVSLKVPGNMLSSGVVLGRSPRNATFLIDDKTLSREHAKLSVDGDGELGIEDLGTTNGTRLNGRGLQPGTVTAIRNGDTLDLGGVQLQVARQR